MANGKYKSNFKLEDIQPANWVNIKSYIAAFRGGAGNQIDTDIELEQFPDLGFQSDILKICITGDSMEPQIENGNLVLIEFCQGYIPKNGEIVAVILNGDCLIKVWDIGSYHMMLSSINPDYEPIRINDDDALQVIGKVIWSCKQINKK